MKLKFSYLIISVLVISLGLLIYAIFPRSGTISELVFDKYSSVEFSNITLRANKKEYKFNDKEEINKFLYKLKDIRVRVGKIKEDIKNETEVKMYSKNSSENLGFINFEDKYLKFYGSKDGKYKTTIYKVEEEISIDKLVNSIKGGVEIKEE